VSASRMLLPLAFATILASSVTLIGTSTNIVVSGLMTQYGMPPFGYVRANRCRASDCCSWTPVYVHLRQETDPGKSHPG
jgi:hypothetical protein